MKKGISGIVLCALLAISSSALPNSLTDQEQQVYSAVLKDFADYVVHTDPSVVLVLSPTAPVEGFRREFYPNAPPELDKLWHTMIRVSETPETLTATLGRRHEYKVISENDQKSLRLGKRGPINRIKRKFPRIELLILLSRIGFDELQGSAMVQIERWGLCKTCGAQGRTYLLNKTNGTWTIANNFFWPWNLH